MRVSLCPLLVGFAFLGASSSSAEDKFDPCTLLTWKEIGTVQGERVTDTKASHPPRKGFAVSQCFFTAATFEKSVSLQVTRRGPSPAAKEPKDDWKRLFPTPPAQKAAAAERQTGRPREEKAESTEPVRLKRLGDEAFWLGNRFVGALYVLKGGAYFRISVGGWADESERIEKSRALAQKVLKRI